ncbi:hypothetical protein ACJJTC_003623 [Scirpophaga incertulas]
MRSPLRIGALKNARRHRLTKIQDPPGIDHTKQAAIMLMTGHTPKARLTLNKQGSSRKSGSSPSLVVKKTSPIRKPRTVVSTLRNSSGSVKNASNVSAVDISEAERSVTESQPRKSALRGRSSVRKHDSIRFDLSNLGLESTSDTDILLHYSETSTLTTENSLTLSLSPSSRRSIHSRSRKILEKSIGTPIEASLRSNRSTLTASPSSKSKISSRGTFIVQQALNDSDQMNYSKRVTKSISDSQTTAESAFRTKSPSPRNLETYSIVDLVSVDSDRSVYDSASSIDTSFGTPHDGRSSRRTRSTIDLGKAESSTPYVDKTRKTRSAVSSRSSSMKSSKHSDASAASFQSPKRSKSLSDTTRKHISINSTNVSRSSRNKSQIEDSALLLISDDSQELTINSDKTHQITRSDKSQQWNRKSSRNVTVSSQEGSSTPENRQSPEEAVTPVLNIQSLLDSSYNSQYRSARKHSRRKTIGAIGAGSKRQNRVKKSKSLNFTARRGLLRLSDDAPNLGDTTVTPKSAVKPEQEAVKNKHSTAKKPQSKRAIIDEIGDADIVRKLFNSPVKRKLSQSMTEFSRSLNDEVTVRKPMRHTIALTGRTPDNSVLENTEAFTPDRFVSPLNTPNDSPNLSGIKRLFKKNTPENDLRNVKGLKSLMRTPKPRRSIVNDLTDVAGVKRVFARSPENRLSDVNVKDVFAEGPKDDLRRVSGVKRALERNSPRNDLSDVRGVKRMFGRGPRDDYDDVSGVEELFDLSVDSNREDSAFDRLIGKPTVKNVYSKSLVRSVNKLKTKKGKTLHASIDAITANVEEWLDKELEKRLQNEKRKTVNRELQNLVTDTVEGRSESHLPIKKRSSANAMQTSINGSKRSVNSSVKSSLNALLRKTILKPSLDALAKVTNVSSRKSTGSKQVSLDASLNILKNTSSNDSTSSKQTNASLRSSSALKHKLSNSLMSSSLPLKKRPLVHSTPLKGRARFLDPPRTSPIPPVIDSSPDKLEEVKPVSSKPKTRSSGNYTGKTRHKAEIPQLIPKSSVKSVRVTVTKPSPVFKPDVYPKTSVSLQKSPVLPQKSVSSPNPAPRTRRNTARKINPKKDEQPPKKVKELLEINEERPKRTRSRKQTDTELPKSPKITRKLAEKMLKDNEVPKTTRSRRKPEIEPPITRKTRSCKEIKVVTPKANTTRKTRARVEKGTVVVAKSSPQLKSITVTNLRKSRKTVASEVMIEAKRRKLESPKQSRKNTRAVKTVNEKPDIIATISKSRVKTELDKVVKPTRSSRRKVNVVEPVQNAQKQNVQNKKVPQKMSALQKAANENHRKEKAEVLAAKEGKITRKGKAEVVPKHEKKVEKALTTRKIEEPPPSRKRKAPVEEVIPRKTAKVAGEKNPTRDKKTIKPVETKSVLMQKTRSTRSKATPTSVKASETTKPASVAVVKPIGRSRRR